MPRNSSQQQKLREKDNLLLNKVSDSHGNTDIPYFLFKMSHERMNIAMKTNKDGYHFLQEEYWYFDGKVK